MGTDALRKCNKCGTEAHTEEELESFVKCKQHTYGRRPRCKECEREREKARRANDKEGVLRRRQKHYAENTYKVSYEFYLKAMASSDKCQICDATENLCYDHDHEIVKTDGEAAFRGVLCNSCNRNLGHFGDNLEGIKKVEAYLKGEFKDE